MKWTHLHFQVLWVKIDLRNQVRLRTDDYSTSHPRNLQANPFWKYIVLHIPNLYKSNVKKNNTKSHRNEYRQKNENPTNPKKSMDLPANNACFQADSFMSERIVGRDWWNERTKANTRARESGRELEEKAQHIFHFPLQVKKHMNYGCEQANSARIWSLTRQLLAPHGAARHPPPHWLFQRCYHPFLTSFSERESSSSRLADYYLGTGHTRLGDTTSAFLHAFYC